MGWIPLQDKDGRYQAVNADELAFLKMRPDRVKEGRVKLNFVLRGGGEVSMVYESQEADEILESLGIPVPTGRAPVAPVAPETSPDEPPLAPETPPVGRQPAPPPPPIAPEPAPEPEANPHPLAEWIPAQEASERTGLALADLRAQIDEGEIRSRVVGEGEDQRIEIDASSLVATGKMF